MGGIKIKKYKEKEGDENGFVGGRKICGGEKW